MNSDSIALSLRAAPRLASAAFARRRLGAVLRNDPALTALCALKPVRDLLLGLADHSPFLWGLIEEDRARAARLLAEPPHATLQAIIATLAEARGDEASIMRLMRRARRECALLVAFADIGGLWDVVEVTRALSAFADAAVSCALRHLLRNTGGRLLIDPEAVNPEDGCGLVVLALGKHGARELNYSSDVDLIVFFDPDAASIPPGVEPGPLFVRITRALARLLQERTGDGHVLRVDLRLRPDPGATAVAMALPSAFSYYETLGQNWERAAMIKARPVAGDKALGARFLRDLAPFIWRKYFDYAAIADIHAMKRQIHAVRGHERVVVLGHDIKLGRGGIREIEFFVQTQQLIFGGRRPLMRGARTLDMLAELKADGWVSDAAEVELTAAYVYLRRLEHRLQMVADEQTQRLPFDAEPLARFAKFCGYDRLPRFVAETTRHLTLVEAHYARLFEHAPGLDSQRGSLVFTGVADDPETLDTLLAMGFQNPAKAAETIRGWHFGRRPALRGARAREALTELTPALLEAFAGSGDPDAALDALDSALIRMPAATELFSILRSNLALRELFADVLGSAPRLAKIIAARPHVLDGAIDPASAVILDEDSARARVASHVARATSFEDALDRARDFAIEEKFLIGVRLLSGALDPDRAGRAYSALAEGVLAALMASVESAFSLEHGRVNGGRAALLALGKLGSREMTASSDLDLMLIYDFPDDSESDGARPLSVGSYYARLTMRIVAALTAPTRAGKLYDVDLRLRPSGRMGPVATQLSSFVRYQAEEAETWEHMAISRARIVAGDASLGRQVEAVLAATLGKTRDAVKCARDVRAMRALIAREKGDADVWNLKLVAGGLLDIEFIAQFLVLAHAAAHPAVADVATRAILENAGRSGLISAARADALVDAHRLHTGVAQVMRLAVEGPFDPARAAAGVLRRIAAVAGLPDFSALVDALAESRAAVRGAFAAIVR